MKTKYPSVVGLIVAVLVGLSFQLFAQEKRAATEPAAVPQKKISSADKAAIKEIFKGVDPSKYRLEFDGGKDTMGSKKVSMNQIRQVQKVRNPIEAPAWVVYVVLDHGAMFCFVATSNQRVLAGTLGKEKMARLNHIMAKYAQ